MKKMSKTIVIVLFLVVALLLTVSCKTALPKSQPENNGMSVGVVYEGVFIDNVQEVLDIIDEIRGDMTPLEHLKIDEFHVTVSFMPKEPMLNKVGTKVKVNIVGYENGMVTVDGVTAYAEALSVRLEAEDEELQQYFEKNAMNWHITCSYSHKPVYSKYMDFSNALPVYFVVMGTFAAYLGDGAYAFSPDDLQGTK